MSDARPRNSEASSTFATPLDRGLSRIGTTWRCSGHILETELKTEGGAQPIIMTQPPLASQQEEDTMAEILVEKLGVPAFFIANKSVMSLYGGGQMTGIAVDSGHDTTYIVPSYQGNPVQEATLVLRLGGRHVTEQLMNQLLNGKYSFPDDNFMLWRKKKKTNFTVSSRKEIIREMKVENARFEISKYFNICQLNICRNNTAQ